MRGDGLSVLERAAIEQGRRNAGRPKGVAVGGSAQSGIAPTLFDRVEYILTSHAALAEAASDMRILLLIHSFSHACRGSNRTRGTRPAVEIDVGRLVGDAVDRAERYRASRDASIVIDEAIKGGTPVIRGTCMTVYSVLGRIEHGEMVDDILSDNSDLSRGAVETAIIYARTHPLIGRPGERPWATAA